jgi:hypothetical protein
MRRSLSFLAVACAAVSLAAVAPTAASATPAAQPAAPAQPATHVRSAAHAVDPATLRAALAAHNAATPHVARLDPSLQSTRAAKNGTVPVTVSGDAAKAAAAVRNVGGRVLASVSGAVSAVVPAGRLSELAGSAGIASVARSVKAYVQGDSEGVGASNAGPASTATSWQGSGNMGSNVNVAIVDAGFANLAAEVTAGHLPNPTTVTGDHCNNVDNTQHGTAVAEIVHQMAPDAQLLLYCVDDNVGFAQAETELATAGATVVNSSLGFPGDSRGDGTGATDSAAATVKKARQAGILWIQSAGNNGRDHWSGKLADANPGGGDGLADLAGTAFQDEFDSMYIAPGVGNLGTAILQFDGWPTSRAKIAVEAFGYQCGDANCTPSQLTPINADGSPVIGGNQTPIIDSVAQSPNPAQAPVLGIQAANTSASLPQEWDIYVMLNSPLPTVHYDLSYWGDVQRSYFAQQNPGRAASGSITEPSSSPYAVAAGAACVLANQICSPGSLEPFSSQGPTIDGRVKPDITGWDSVSTYLPEFGGTFYGTSAAAPHVAGAAALVKGQNPTWDASQIQNFLEQRANSNVPLNPPTNQLGHGRLTLGSTTSTLPQGAKYQAIAPTRILDTRTTTGGHHAPLGKGTTVTVAVPGLPADAKAVAVNLTGIHPNATTYLSLFPGGTAWPHTSNLNMSPLEPTAAVFAIVSIKDAAHHSITVRNNAGSINVAIDLIGYFGTGTETGAYTPLPTPNRVLDTRNDTGGHHFKVPANGNVTVDPLLPAGATVAIVNITVVNPTQPGSWLNAAPTCSKSTSTLNFTKYVRANMAVVGLNSGTFCIANNTSATDVVVDVLGYMSSSGSTFVALPAPVRIVDTRTGNGGRLGAVAGNSSQAVDGAGVDDVPYTATALFTGVLEASATISGYLMAYPGVTQPAVPTSTLNFSPGRIVPNAAIIGIPSPTERHFSIYNSGGNTHVVVDLFGYFLP